MQKHISLARRATQIMEQAGLDAAVDSLKPLIDEINASTVSSIWNPLRDIEWDEDTIKDEVLSHWREAIKQWQINAFEGDMPGKRALQEILENHMPSQLHGRPLDDEQGISDVKVADASLCDILEAMREEMPDELFEAFEESINDAIEATWLEDARRAGIPSQVRAEVWWVPGWDGHSLDDTDHVHIKGDRWNSTYIEDVLPSDGLRNFLQWINVSSDEFVAAALVHRPSEGEKLKDRLNEAKFHVEKDVSRPTMASPEQALTMIENAGYTHCLPTVHAHVELNTLINLDPRLPIALPLPKGKAHIGFHDTINGAGYMDMYEGTAVIPPMSLGMGWATRGRYGIEDTYGLYRPAFYCKPENVPPQQSDTESSHEEHRERMRA